MNDLTARRLIRMEKALRMLGYSAHSGSPRIGPKAQVARWGLMEDVLPSTEDKELGEPLRRTGERGGTLGH